MEREFSAVFKHNDPWWIGWSPELEGAYGQGRTLDEARESLREAIQLVLEDIAAQAAEREPGRRRPAAKAGARAVLRARE